MSSPVSGVPQKIHTICTYIVYFFVRNFDFIYNLGRSIFRYQAPRQTTALMTDALVVDATVRLGVLGLAPSHSMWKVIFFLLQEENSCSENKSCGKVKIVYEEKFFLASGNISVSEEVRFLEMITNPTFSFERMRANKLVRKSSRVFFSFLINPLPPSDADPKQKNLF